MSDLVAEVKHMYEAFGRGDVPAILDHLADDVVWESEAPAIISWGGIRRGKAEAAGFFAGIANDSSHQKLEMTAFLTNDDAVAAFGRYAATVNATGIRVDTPVAHYFQFRDGKVIRYVNIINTAAFVEAWAPAAASAAG